MCRKYQLSVSWIGFARIKQSDNPICQNRMQFGVELINDKSRSVVKSLDDRVSHREVLDGSFRFHAQEWEAGFTFCHSICVILQMSAKDVIVTFLYILNPKASVGTGDVPLCEKVDPQGLRFLPL